MLDGKADSRATLRRGPDDETESMMSAGRNCAGDVSMNTHVWHEQQRPPMMSTSLTVAKYSCERQVCRFALLLRCM